MPKRKMSYSQHSSYKKKKSASRQILKPVSSTGDIVPANFQRFGANVVRPTPITRTKLRYYSTNISGGTTTGSVSGLSFALSSAANYTDFTALFDQYRIVAVEVSFQPFYSQVPLSVNAQGRLFTAIDYDDANAPAGSGALRPYPSCRVVNAWQSCIRTLVPHCAEALYSGAFTSFGNKGATWIDSASPSVQHYGLKIAAEASPTIGSSWFVEVSLFVEFKNIRAV